MSEPVFKEEFLCLCGGSVDHYVDDFGHLLTCNDCNAFSGKCKDLADALGQFYYGQLHKLPEDQAREAFTTLVSDMEKLLPADGFIKFISHFGIYDVGIKGPDGEKGPEMLIENIIELEKALGMIKEDTPTDTQKLIAKKCDELKELLLEKNRKYGDSAINPCRVFSKASATEQILVRMDDKINRIKNRQNDEDEDVIKDLAGYCILYMIAKEKESE